MTDLTEVAWVSPTHSHNSICGLYVMNEIRFPFETGLNRGKIFRTYSFVHYSPIVSILPILLDFRIIPLAMSQLIVSLLRLI